MSGFGENIWQPTERDVAVGLNPTYGAFAVTATPLAAAMLDTVAFIVPQNVVRLISSLRVQCFPGGAAIALYGAVGVLGAAGLDLRHMAMPQFLRGAGFPNTMYGEFQHALFFGGDEVRVRIAFDTGAAANNGDFTLTWEDVPRGNFQRLSS